MAITSMPGAMVCSNQSPRLPQVLWGNSTMATEAEESGGDGSSRGAGQCWQREAAQSIVIELLTRSETGLQELSMVVQVKQVSSLSATKLKYVTSGTGKKNIIFLFLLCITLFYPILQTLWYLLLLCLYCWWSFSRGPNQKRKIISETDCFSRRFSK